MDPTRRALVVEHDERMRRALDEMLRQSGFTVASTADEDVAAAVVDEGPVELAFVHPSSVHPSSSDPDRSPVVRRLRQSCCLLLVRLPPEPTDTPTRGAGPPRSKERPDGLQLPTTQQTEPRHLRVTPRVVGDLEVDRPGLCVYRRGEPLRLSRQDMRLLSAFVDHPGKVLSRPTLRQLVWDGTDVGSPRAVDMAVRRLRLRIEDEPSTPRYITTVRGRGYRLEAPASTVDPVTRQPTGRAASPGDGD